MNTVHHYVLLGPQGSGKGTQGKLLSEEIHTPHISTGVLFRAAVSGGTPLGFDISARLARGDLILDDTVNALVAEALAGPDAVAGYILDGYPRTMAQVQYLEAVASPRLALLFTLEDDEAVARLAGRRVCPSCEAVYHIKRRPSRVEDVCDVCGSKLIARKDDTPEAIRRRLLQYHKETEPIIAYYEQQNRLVRVDGRLGVMEMYQAVRQAIGL